MMNISPNRIRLTRRSKDMTGEEVANLLGISKQYYYNIERGRRNLSAEHAITLSKIFDVTSDYLLGLSDSPDTNSPIPHTTDEPTLNEELMGDLYQSMCEVSEGSTSNPKFQTRVKKLVERESEDIKQIYNIEFDYTLDGITQVCHEMDNPKLTTEFIEMFERVKLALESSPIPSWATSKDVRDFKKMLEDDEPVMFDGVPIEGEARQRVKDILTGLFWESKEMNKKTYGRKKKADSDDKE